MNSVTHSLANEALLVTLYWIESLIFNEVHWIPFEEKNGILRKMINIYTGYLKHSKFCNKVKILKNKQTFE